MTAWNNYVHFISLIFTCYQTFILYFRDISQRELLRNGSSHLKPGMRGPRTGSTMTSESSALPSSAALPWQMAATCTLARASTGGAAICARCCLKALLRAEKTQRRGVFD